MTSKESDADNLLLEKVAPASCRLYRGRLAVGVAGKTRLHFSGLPCQQDRIRHARRLDRRFDVMRPQNVRAFKYQRSLSRKRSIKASLGGNILAVAPESPANKRLA